jgi:predicted RNA-binding protein with PUA-like domain
MALRYWLFKSEPGAYSYDDLANDGTAEWDGVRNYQARNLLRDDIKKGDGVLFYHSSTTNLAVIGTARVERSGYPDFTAWGTASEHPDSKSTPANPIWYMVDIRAEQRFPNPVSREAMKAASELGSMVLLKKGRLSVQPVTESEWQKICRMGGLT